MSAIHHLISHHIDIWTAADTEKKSGRGRRSSNGTTVYGVKKLRELILELAVRGKLVPQDPKDEPASELLKKIQAEKAKLIAEGKIKKEKPLSPITVAEKLFDLPNGWALCRWNTVAMKIGDIDHKMPETVSDGIPYVSPRDFFPNNIIDFNGAKQISRQDYLRLAEKIKPDIGDLIYPRYGTIGENRLVDVQKDFLASYSCAVIKTMKGFINPRYQYFFSISNYCKLQARAAENKTTQANVGIASIQSYIIPLPPLAEQYRIVAKVNELMALCDQLETQHINAVEAHEKLVSQLLATLTQSRNAEDFSENWQRIVAHFDTLFTTEASIDALKQTLLQLAVRGKLVPHDLNDESASELLEKIRSEKSKLIAEGKIKKEKPLLPIGEEEKSFAAPPGWSWTRLGSLVLESGAGWSPSCDGGPRIGESWGVLKVSAVSWGKFLPDENKALPPNLDPRKDCEVRKGDFLVSRANTAELVARSVVVDEVPNHLMMSDKIVRLRLTGSCDKSYVNLVNGCAASRSYYMKVAGGTSSSMKNVSREQILNLVFAMPPLSEQNRIVAKVDELMTLCDELKSRLITANQLQQQLADVFVERTLISEFHGTSASPPSRDDARALLGAEIIHQLHNEKTFGQVKLQKLVHLCEHIAGVDAAAGEYQRFAAGPHDPAMIAAIEFTLKQKEWYEEYPRDKFGHAYRPLKNAGVHRKEFCEYWRDKLPTIQKLIDLARKWDTEHCEIFSTLYAAWNDLLLLGKPVSDEAILSEVLERWHERKTKIPKKTWLKHLEWLRKSDFVPTGTGRPTRSEGLFE